MLCLAFFLKALREGAFLTDTGKWFHNLGVAHKNELSTIATFDVGAAKEPSVDDLSVRLRHWIEKIRDASRCEII